MSWPFKLTSTINYCATKFVYETVTVNSDKTSKQAV